MRMRRILLTAIFSVGFSTATLAQLHLSLKWRKSIFLLEKLIL